VINITSSDRRRRNGLQCCEGNTCRSPAQCGSNGQCGFNRAHRRLKRTTAGHYQARVRAIDGGSTSTERRPRRLCARQVDDRPSL